MGEAYVGVHSLPCMGWLSRLFGRSGSVQEEPKTFEELEQEVQGQIAEDYAQKNVDAQSDVLSELDDDTLAKPKVEQSKVPVDFHVEKAEAIYFKYCMIVRHIYLASSNDTSVRHWSLHG